MSSNLLDMPEVEDATTALLHDGDEVISRHHGIDRVCGDDLPVRKKKRCWSSTPIGSLAVQGNIAISVPRVM